MRLIVPYAAGDGTDAIARAIGEHLGQTIVVENNGVDGGNVATPTKRHQGREAGRRQSLFISQSRV